MGKIIEVNEEFVKEQLGELVRGSVEETLNGLLDKEADRLCGAERYEHTDARKDTRAGHYERTLQTKAGEVTLKVPKLRTLPFETAIIERYRRRECSIEEALIEMYLAGCFSAAGGGYYRSLVGHESFRWYDQRVEQESVRQYREMAQPSDRNCVSLRVS